MIVGGALAPPSRGSQARGCVNRSIQRLRRVSLIEGVSWLLLLFVAMPLKYIADLPMAVKIGGWVHGVLFMWFVLQWQSTRLELDWPARRSIRSFVSALVPFGPWLMRIEDESD